MENEKFLFDIQTNCGDIANKILNVVIDAEQAFKCKWPNHYTMARLAYIKNVNAKHTQKVFVLFLSYISLFVYYNYSIKGV